MQRGDPELVRKYGCTSGVRAIVLRIEQAAQHRLEPHHFKIGAVDHASVDFTCLAEPLRREVDGGKGAEFAGGLQVGAYVSDLRNRERGIVHL